MMRAAVSSLLLFLSAGASVRDSVTPVERVISLLTKLSAQVQAEGVEEAASYDKYACFCKAHADEKVYEIAKSDKKIKELAAQIEALKSEIAELDDDVAKNKKEVAGEEKTMKKNQEARDKDAKEYGKKRKDLVEAVEATKDALATLQQSKGDVDDAVSSLLQKVPMPLTSMPALALIADAQAGGRYKAAQEPAGYKFQSKEVIATLKSLVATFKKSLAELDSAEISANGDFEMARGARRNTVTALEKDTNEKETLSASKGEEKSDAEEQKKQESDARKADQAFLDDLTSKCEDKAKAWDKRSTTRASEITALTQAVELLKGMGDAYESNAKLVGFLQLQSIRRHGSSEAQLEELTSNLRTKAHSLRSMSLTMVALNLQMGGPDHFVKVRGIIKDLIKKLEDDAKAEATAKGICDKNMKAAIDKRDKTAGQAEIAGAEIDATTADIAKLKEEIAELSQVIADSNKQLLEMTELRAKEKAENLKTIANADGGKKAVDQAIGLLKKFYGSALLQSAKGAAAPAKDREGNTVGDLAPDTFSSKEEYKGKTDSSKGIVGMLEVISSDFERTIKTVKAAEKSGEEDYKELKSDTEKDIKDKEKLKKTKETEVETKESDLTGFKDDKRTAKKLNEQALEELEKLQTSCVDTGETYAERAAHRKEEIEALKQAMDILENWKD